MYMEDLNQKQIDVLNFIKMETNKKGYPPSIREICKAVGFKSTSTAHAHLSKLEEKGYIQRDAAKPRAIEILNNNTFENLSYNKKIINIPVIGKVAAGEPILAVENIEDIFPLSTDFIYNDSNTFILIVKGESMINAGILNNDYVIVNQQSVATNGDIVVALIEDEATIKRFYKESNHIRLQPENDLMEPIIVQNVTILGKVIGIYRKI